MKAILISVRPQWAELILNYIKKDEIRKGTAIGKAINKLIEEQGVAPMLIYCTKGKPYVYDLNRYSFAFTFTDKRFIKSNHLHMNNKEVYQYLNGKVVARFNATAEEIKYHFGYYNMGERTESYILENSCLTAKELDNYLQASKNYDETKVSKVCGYAIHINDLKPFDKPKELKEFEHLVRYRSCKKCPYYGNPRACEKLPYCCEYEKIYKAPQSWCYVEVEDENFN